MSVETFAWSAAITGGLSTLLMVGEGRRRARAGVLALDPSAKGSAITFATFYWLALPLLLILYGWRRTVALYFVCALLTSAITWPVARKLGLPQGGLANGLIAGVVLAPFTSVLPRLVCSMFLAQRHSVWRHLRLKNARASELAEK